MKLFFDDAEFDGQLQRTAAKAACRAADLGQVLAVARRITPGDYGSWYGQWFAEGRKEAELARAESARGHHHNAGEAWLRASEYFRSAYFFSRRYPQGAALLAAWRRCREAFRAALPSLPFAIEPVQIPWSRESPFEIPVEGYVLRTANGAAAPTVLMPCGYDSPVEEFYSLGGYEAALRGFNVVAFSGPGQAEMLYERGIPFRPDFESVVGPVIDFVERTARSGGGLDATRIAIVGRSFGGYLAPRAASREPRIGALAADPAQTDMAAVIAQRFKPEWRELLERGDPALNDRIWAAFPGIRGQEFWLSRLRAHGLDTPLDYCREMRRWTVDVEAISCPAFVSYGEGDFAEATTTAFFERLPNPDKRLVVYRDADGSGGHCEGMGPTRYFSDLYGWLRDLWP
jgi:pimeloyl-ACP methyl ester carboxylesterase